MRFKLLVLTFVFLFFGINPVFASSMIINEIMYDLPGSDTDHEWIELYNTGNDPVTIIGGSISGAWRINDGTNHLLSTTPAQGSLTIPSESFAIIAKNPSVFLSDYPSFSGTIIQSSISLNNAGATVGLRIDSNGVFFDEFSYQNTLGATEDGNSLQRKSDGNWIAAFPTPGSQNANNPPPPSPTPTLTPSPTPSPTPTRTPTPTKTPTPAPTPKKTVAPTSTPSPTPARIATQSVAGGPTPNLNKPEISYRIASVAGTTIVASASATASSSSTIEVKDQKQTNPLIWIGLIFILAGAGSIGYIYLKKNAKLHLWFRR